MAHATQQPHPRIELAPSAPSAALTATLYSSGSLSFVERGPRGGYYATTVPAAELPKLLAFLAENGHGATPEPTGPLSSFDYELLADALDALDPDGSEATRRKQELEAWARQMAATGRGYLPALQLAPVEIEALGGAMAFARSFVDDWNSDEGMDAESRAEAERGERDVDRAERLLEKLAANPAPPTRVLAVIEGGVVQHAIADRPGVRLLTLDYDTDGNQDEVRAIPQSNGRFDDAYLGEIEAVADAARLDEIAASKLAYAEAASA